jgi:hypothetical protein
MTDHADQHRDHVTTVPTEGVAPEFHHYPVNKEPGANVQGDDINIPLVVASVAVSAILLFVTVVFLQAWYFASMAEETDAKMEPYAPLMQARAEQQDQLNNPHWVKDAKGVATIPIDKAIELTVAQCNGTTTEGSK